MKKKRFVREIKVGGIKNFEFFTRKCFCSLWRAEETVIVPMGIACDSHISFRVCMLVEERAAFRKREEKEEEKVCVMWEIACSVRSPKKEEEELGEEILPSTAPN